MPETTSATWPALLNRTASAADVEAKFDWAEGHRLPMNNGALQSGAFDFGLVGGYWGTGYFSGDYVNNGSTITSTEVQASKMSAWAFSYDVSSGLDDSFNISSMTLGATGTTFYFTNTLATYYAPAATSFAGTIKLYISTMTSSFISIAGILISGTGISFVAKD